MARDRYDKVERKREQVASELKRLTVTRVPLNGGFAETLRAYDLPPVAKAITALEFLRRPQVDYRIIMALGLGDPALDAETGSQVEIEAKYESYIANQMREVERIRKLEQRALPEDIDYEEVSGLSNEAREKFQKFRPLTVGQASRIGGVTPSDVSVLLVHLERRKAHPAGRSRRRFAVSR